MKSLIYIFISLVLFACRPENTQSNNGEIELESKNNFRKLGLDEKQMYHDAVSHLYDSLFKRNFNGSILVAKNGQIIFEEYKGYDNITSKDTITANTSFHIASVSKTFTSVAILKLWEENKINLDEPVENYLKDFPYTGITVRMLLNHRSGLPNYAYFMIEDTTWKRKGRIATNNDMLEYMVTNKPPIAAFPDRRFQYCNTNYSLLALIIEKITGKTFPEYLSQTIFQPLGMKNTFVFSIKDTADYKPSYNYNNTIFPLENMDCIYGDKNVYSTPRELLLWDQALYTENIIKQSTFELATQPTSHERPSIHNYGLGFRLMIFPNNYKVVYHNGWWHGNNAVFSRLVQDTATIIVMGNKFNRQIYKASKIGFAFTDALDPNKAIEEAEPAMPATK